MNLISGWMKIATRANKPPALVTARMKRMTADHSRRKRRGFFFGEAANCTLLDDTWNTGMSLFLSGERHIFVRAPGEDKPSPLLCSEQEVTSSIGSRARTSHRPYYAPSRWPHRP